MSIPQYRVNSKKDEITGLTMYQPQKKFFNLFWWDLYHPSFSEETAFSIIIDDKNYQNYRKK